MNEIPEPLPDPLIFKDMGKLYEVVQLDEHTFYVPEPLDPFYL